MHDTAAIKDVIKQRWNESSETYDCCLGHGIQSEQEKEAWNSLLKRAIGVETLDVPDEGLRHRRSLSTLIRDRASTSQMECLEEQRRKQMTGVSVQSSGLMMPRIYHSRMRHLILSSMVRLYRSWIVLHQGL